MTQTARTIKPVTLAASAIVPAAISLIRRHSGNQCRVPRLSMTARMSLVTHEWGSDPLALDACIQQALVLCNGEVIGAEDLRLAQDNAQRAQSRVLGTLRAVNGVRSEAAKRLGINASTLRRQLAAMRAQGVSVPETAPAVTELSHE